MIKLPSSVIINNQKISSCFMHDCALLIHTVIWEEKQLKNLSIRTSPWLISPWLISSTSCKRIGSHFTLDLCTDLNPTWEEKWLKNLSVSTSPWPIWSTSFQTQSQCHDIFSSSCGGNTSCGWRRKPLDGKEKLLPHKIQIIMLHLTSIIGTQITRDFRNDMAVPTWEGKSG